MVGAAGAGGEHHISVRGLVVMRDGKWIPELKPTMSVADAARHVLTVRFGVVRRRLPLALNEAEQDSEHIHQLRVGTRRANAALRIFADCLPKRTRRAARRALRTIRRAAGQGRDWDVFEHMLTSWGHEQPANRQPGIDFLLGYSMAQRVAAQQHLRDVAEHD